MTVRRTTWRSEPRIWLPLLVAPILLLTACGGDDDDDGAAQDQPADPNEQEDGDEPAESSDESVLNVHLYNDPRNWDITAAYHGPDQQVMGLIYQKLLVQTPDGEYDGRLAENWEFSDDATTITFHLYDGLNWSDGEPLTSSDVKFSFELLANSEATANANQFEAVVGWSEFNEGQADEIVGFQTPDDQTFVVELSEPNVGFLATLSSQSKFVVPEHILGDVPIADIEGHPYWQEPTVGYGPYNFARYETDQFVEVEANAAYHLGTPEIDRIFLRSLTSDVAAAQLGTGETDLAFISATDLATVEAFDDVSVREAEGTGFLRIAIDMTQERFQDERVIQAMHYAIDRQAIVDTILEGYGSVAPVAPYLTEWALADDLNDYAYDPERARELLDEAGWDSSQPVEIYWTTGSRDRDAMMPVVQAQWNEVGIETELQGLEAGVQYDDWELAFYGGGALIVEPSEGMPSHGCDWGQNNSSYCNEEVDALWAEANATTDTDERAELYQEISRIINEDPAYVYMVNQSQLWAHNDRLEGFVPNGDFVNGFQQAHEWSIAD